MAEEGLKPLVWIASSKRDFGDFPEDVCRECGFALFQAQRGHKAAASKVLKGFGGAHVLEVIENNDSGTYRVVYTVKFAKAVYVLHAFQKKSKSGIKTSQQDIEKIKDRLQMAARDYILRFPNER
jgi:phage-related protein